MAFVPPLPHAIVDLPMADGSLIRVRRHGNLAGHRLLVSHGNGFAADAYLPFWAPLLRDWEVVVFDCRNHGQNLPSDPAHHTYAQMTRDLDCVLDGVALAWGSRKSAGAFHSMSARVAMKHAIEIGWRWDALALFDPPNFPPAGHALYDTMRDFEDKLAGWARNRRARFADPAELAAEYRDARGTANWVEGEHELMARSVSRRDDDGGYVLACAPALEAAIYLEARTLDLWPRGDRFAGPVKLIGADPACPYGPPTGRVNQAYAGENGVDYVAVLGARHMLQIERPDICREALLAFLAANGMAP